MKKRILSGVQPTGALHLGNYIGALRQWVDLQHETDAYFCIVDYHAITVKQDTQELYDNIHSLAAMYVAVGLDPSKVTLFKQSDVSAHTELAWILNNFTHMGELQRMTQYKDKAKGNGKQTVGLFTYPVLMAADILLYQPHMVPVGEDQKQHVELTRNIAQRFNNRFSETFRVPDVMHPKDGARIMSLDDPNTKMSKTGSSQWGYIALSDAPDVVMKKIKKAVTDSGSTIEASADKPALTNLLVIYSAVSGKTVGELEELYHGQGYGKFKKELGEAIVTWLEPIQERYHELIQNYDELQAILKQGQERASVVAQVTLDDVKTKIGVI
ncbi:MAG: tryptophan--tRNA ligase [bacterium]|nr:tryptophan--tRNA ligase [bacterium]